MFNVLVPESQMAVREVPELSAERASFDCGSRRFVRTAVIPVSSVSSASARTRSESTTTTGPPSSMNDVAKSLPLAPELSSPSRSSVGASLMAMSKIVAVAVELSESPSLTVTSIVRETALGSSPGFSKEIAWMAVS